MRAARRLVSVPRVAVAPSSLSSSWLRARGVRGLAVTPEAAALKAGTTNVVIEVGGSTDSGPKCKLLYYNRRGRAEPARLMFAEAGVEYEDERFETSEWPKLKAKQPFGQIPVLDVDGVRIAQSSAIHQYLAERFDLRGHNPLESARVTMIAEGASDLRYKYVMANREGKLDNFFEKTLPEWAGYFEKLLSTQDAKVSGFYVGARISYADLNSFNAWSNIVAKRSDALKAFPLLAKHTASIGKRERIAKWIAQRPKTDE